MDTLTLYTDLFWISPYVFTAWVGLREKELPFETVSMSLGAGDQRRPEYRDATITGRVPALRHGDFWLAESSAIVEYLDEVYPTPRHRSLLPADVRDRARARQLLAWIRSDLMPIREERSTHTMFYAKADKPLSPAGEAAADRLLHVADLLVPKHGDHLFGEWSIADSDLAFLLHRLILNDHPVPERIARYAREQWLRPSVRSFVDRERIPYVPY